MTISQFFEKLLESQSLLEEQLKTLSGHREEVEGYLREKFGQEPTIRYAGSKAKGTMITESYDLDIVCYFPHDKDTTIKEIYDSVQKILSSKYVIEPKSSAVRIKGIDKNIETDYHIDVVPGKFIDGDDGDVFLHVVYGEKERIQTNIDTHIAYVKDSGCQDVIKLMKLWKERNGIPFKTFVLEIVVVETLKGSNNKDNFPESLRKIFTFLRDEIESVRLLDPANSNNIVSESISGGDKDAVASKAAEVLKILENKEGDEIARWQEIFDEEIKAGGGWSGPTRISNPPNPHLSFDACK